MVYLAVDKDGTETIFNEVPPLKKKAGYWSSPLNIGDSIELPKGTIKKLTGKDLTFEDGYRTYTGENYDPTPE